MKNLKFFLILTLVCSGLITKSQTTPTSVNRGSTSFTQVDSYLSVLKRLGIPTANGDVLDGLTSSQNTVKIIYNTALNKLRIYNPVTSSWRDAVTVDLSSYYTKAEVTTLLSLLPMDEGNGVGFRLATQDLEKFGNIGLGAVDVSSAYVLDPANPIHAHLIPYNTAGTYGATGRFAFAAGGATVASGNQAVAFGLGSIATGTSSFVTGYLNKSGGAQGFVSGVENAIITPANGASILGGRNNTVTANDATVTASRQGIINNQLGFIASTNIGTIGSPGSSIISANNATIQLSSGSAIKATVRSHINSAGGFSNLIAAAADSKIGNGNPAAAGVQSPFANVLLGTHLGEIQDSVGLTSIISSNNSVIKAGPNSLGGFASSIIASSTSSITLKAAGSNSLAHNNVILASQASHIPAPYHNAMLAAGSMLEATNRNQLIVGVSNIIDPDVAQNSAGKKTFIVGNGWGSNNVPTLRSNAFHVTHGGDSWTQNTAYASKFQLNDLNTAPASSTAAGVKGEIRVTDTHIYVCIATNTWVRSSLTTW